ncbi:MULTISPECIES: SIS domain-containing protein [unclassified Halanaerobium]|uniref:SIS domain-containing protein n=1 Tax=unclassified Halanaerobium TaxID=2641197 RepID=UPI000DF22DB2|nr:MULTISPECIES: SIS domain-containing protein [unclassified Halanaerobium]
MLKIDKNKVDFLVTDNMVSEVETIIKRDFPKIEKLVTKMDSQNIKKIYFVACGSPLCACQTAELLFRKYSNIECASYSGWDFLDQTPKFLNKQTAVIGVSDSGNTKEVADSIMKAKKQGAFTLGFTKNEEENLLTKSAENLIAYKADCIWEVHLLLTYYLSIKFILKKEENKELRTIISDIKKLPSILKNLVKTTEKKSKRLGKKAAKWPFIYTISSGATLPLGYKEGVITMLEFTWTHGSSLNAAEFRHGPLEVVDKDVPYIFILGNDETRHTTKRALNFVKKFSENYIIFDIEDYIKGLHPMLAPFILFVPLEYFYYYLSISKGHNPDDRRYYGGIESY